MHNDLLNLIKIEQPFCLKIVKNLAESLRSILFNPVSMIFPIFRVFWHKLKSFLWEKLGDLYYWVTPYLPLREFLPTLPDET